MTPLAFFALFAFTWQHSHANELTAAVPVETAGSGTCNNKAASSLTSAEMQSEENEEGSELDQQISLLQFDLKLSRKQQTGLLKDTEQSHLPQYACMTYVGVLLVILPITQFVCEKRGLMLWHTIDLPTVAGGSNIFKSSNALICYRLACALFVGYLDFLLVKHHDKRQTKTDKLFGSSMAFASFTLWCWNLMGVYFLVAASVSLLHARTQAYHDFVVVRLFCCSAWILFEVAYTCALFVCLMVWCVLVPMLYFWTGSVHALITPFPLIFHNANILMMTVEAMSNRLSMNRAHLFFVWYFAAAYVVFSWAFFERTGWFFYSFIDYRSPLTPAWYTALIIFLGVCFIAGDRKSVV